MLDSHEASKFEVCKGEVERDSGEYFMDNKLVASSCSK